MARKVTFMMTQLQSIDDFNDNIADMVVKKWPGGLEGEWKVPGRYPGGPDRTF
jgi:hypothetical protein